VYVCVGVGVGVCVCVCVCVCVRARVIMNSTKAPTTRNSVCSEKKHSVISFIYMHEFNESTYVHS